MPGVSKDCIAFIFTAKQSVEMKQYEPWKHQKLLAQ
jgi:hypothetical protein